MRVYASKKRFLYPEGYNDCKRFLYSGNANGSSLNDRGFNGNVWSSTANSSNNAYELNFDSDNVNPGMDNNDKYIGFSVRCAF